MIDSDRFIANKALDFHGWVEARKYGVTATEVAKASTNAGFRDIVAGMETPEEIQDNAYMEFGRKQEGPIAMWLKHSFGIMPNEWLIASSISDIYLATPDGLSLDHQVIAEIKTTGKDWDNPPIGYRRQMQWQLFVTDAEYSWFAWMLRAEDRDGNFQPGWIEPKLLRVERDDDMIRQLLEVADALCEVKAKIYNW